MRPWATALRVPTPGGHVWFKASRSAFAHEGPLLDVVGALAPELLPEVLARDPRRGWLLLRDAGERARERPVDWRPLLAAYARLQIATAPLAGTLVEAGVPDRRPALVRRQLESILPSLTRETADGLRSRWPEVEERLALLAASPIPDTLEHGDLHDGNVFVRDGQIRILDWGDASVTHPFLSLSVEMDPSARDAYLEPWCALVSHEQIERDVQSALALRFLWRALNYQRVVPYDASRAAAVEARVAMFLEGG